MIDIGGLNGGAFAGEFGANADMAGNGFQGGGPDVDAGDRYGGALPGGTIRPAEPLPVALQECPPGTRYGQRACPAGMACTQELTCIPDLTTVVAPITQPVEDILRSILGPVTGAIGGAGRQYGVGTAGTRLVSDVGGGGNMLRTLAILLLVGAVGYILYKRYYKRGKAAD
jgi:hypothetical protein